jgi:hypothetical protein
MNITGLIPGQIYSFSVITGTEGGGRHLLVSVDGAGDGNVANDPVVQANQAVTTHFRFTASPAGSALITMDPVNNEGNLAGIQLKLGERLPVLTINRATGEMVISNNTAESASVMGYMIESDAGSLLPTQWTSVTDNYDANSGNHSVDSVSNWMELTQPTERDNLSEVQEIGGTGATIVDGQVVNLGNAWVRSPYEDVSGEVLLSDGTIVPLDVRYTGNEAVIGDLDYNGVVNLDDWDALKGAFSTNSTSFSLAELYGAGDLNLDGRVNLRDMHTFAAAYDTMQGAGAFAAAVGNIAGVPEPATGVGLVLLAATAGIAIRVKKAV